MEILSREYGWTPEQVKRQSAFEIEYYLQIIRTRRKLEEAERRKQQKR